jgi:hypothetical protein
MSLAHGPPWLLDPSFARTNLFKVQAAHDGQVNGAAKVDQVSLRGVLNRLLLCRRL